MWQPLSVDEVQLELKDWKAPWWIAAMEKWGALINGLARHLGTQNS